MTEYLQGFCIAAVSKWRVDPTSVRDGEDCQMLQLVERSSEGVMDLSLADLHVSRCQNGKKKRLSNMEQVYLRSNSSRGVLNHSVVDLQVSSRQNANWMPTSVKDGGDRQMLQLVQTSVEGVLDHSLADLHVSGWRNISKPCGYSRCENGKLMPNVCQNMEPMFQLLQTSSTGVLDHSVTDLLHLLR